MAGRAGRSGGGGNREAATPAGSVWDEGPRAKVFFIIFFEGQPVRRESAARKRTAQVGAAPGELE
jgi:hypothetical protein